MTRFERSLTREMAGMAAVVFAALLAVFSVVLLARILGRAVLGDIDVTAVLPMLVFTLLRFLPELLSVSLFMGTFMVLSRVWRESEAVIWMSAGVGPWGWVRPVAWFALPMVTLIAAMSLEGLPWAEQKQAEYQRLIENKDEVSTFAPGMFTEYAGGQRVHFVETISENGERVGNVFVQARLNGRTGITVAREGVVRTEPDGERYLVLQDGRRYEGNPGAADFRLVEFSTYAVRIEPRVYADIATSPRMLSVAALLEDPSARNLGEWVKRLGFPISALLLALLAIPMSYVNPRAGRSLNVVFAILIYAAYNNFVGLSESWVTRGQMSSTLALGLAHGGMAIVVTLFFWQRFRGPWTR